MSRFKPSFIVLLTSLVVLAQLSTDMYLPAVISMATGFKTSHQVMQFSITIYFIGFAICVFLSGLLSDWFGRRRIILLALIVYILATTVCAFSINGDMFLCGRFLQGLSAGAGTVIVRVIVSDLLDEKESAHVLAYISAGIQCSPLLAPLLGSVISTVLSWHYIFYFLVLCSVVLLAVSSRYLPETKPAHTIPVHSLIKLYKNILKQPTYLGCTLMITISYAGYFSFLLYSPYILMQHFGLSSIEYGLVYTLMVTGYITGSMLVRRYALNKNFHTTLNKALMFSCLGFLLLSLSSYKFFLCLGIFFYLISTGIIMPICQAKAIAKINMGKGVAASLLYFVEFSFASCIGLFSKINILQPNLSTLFMSIGVCSLGLFLISKLFFLRDDALKELQEDVCRKK